jgi:hypothetical protein
MNVAALIVGADDNAAPEAMRSSPARQGHRRCDWLRYRTSGAFTSGAPLRARVQVELRTVESIEFDLEQRAGVGAQRQAALQIGRIEAEGIGEACDLRPLVLGLLR